MATKTVDTISVSDLAIHPVWKYRTGDGLEMTPDLKLPCTTLARRIVGTQVILSDGTSAWAMLGNIDAGNPEFTKHFLTLSIELNGRWFHLARYHDYDYGQRGPVQLAEFLGKSPDQVFPITYDIRANVRSDSAALSGTIEQEPNKKLTRAEIIAMAVP